MELLQKMYDFYQRRYSDNQAEMEKRFNDAVKDLITTGDITKREYTEFCVTHDIEPEVKKKSSSSSSYSYDPCSGGGRNYRGGC
jgi:hypothetical protein